MKTPPEAFAIGRVTLDFRDTHPLPDSLGAFWDEDKKRLRSTTDQLHWYYGDERVELRTEKTQAMIGRGKTVQLPAVAQPMILGRVRDETGAARPHAAVALQLWRDSDGRWESKVATTTDAGTGLRP